MIMHKQVEIIKKNESEPKILENIFSKKEIENFLKLYEELPVTVHNKKQNVIKKRWLADYGKELEKLLRTSINLKYGFQKLHFLLKDNCM